MNKYVVSVLIITISALMSGLCWDLSFKGLSVAFGAIAILSFSIMLQMYLDSGYTNVDNSRKQN